MSKVTCTISIISYETYNTGVSSEVFFVYVRGVAVNVRAFNGFNRIELEHFVDVIVVVVRACESISRHFV